MTRRSGTLQNGRPVAAHLGGMCYSGGGTIAARTGCPRIERDGVTGPWRGQSIVHSGCRTNPKGGGTELWALVRTSVPIPVRSPERVSLHGRGSGLWCGRLCQFRCVSPERVAFRHDGAFCLCHSSMPLVVPFPLRWAWVYGVSCTSPVRRLCADSVPLRWASLHGEACKAPVRGICSDWSRMSVPIPVRRQKKCYISDQWDMRLCHSIMPLVEPSLFHKNRDAVPILKGGGTEVPWKFRVSGQLGVVRLASGLRLWTGTLATCATAAVAALQGYGRWESEVSPLVCPEVWRWERW